MSNDLNDARPFCCPKLFFTSLGISGKAEYFIENCGGKRFLRQQEKGAQASFGQPSLSLSGMLSVVQDLPQPPDCSAMLMTGENARLRM